MKRISKADLSRPQEETENPKTFPLMSLTAVYVNELSNTGSDIFELSADWPE